MKTNNTTLTNENTDQSIRTATDHLLSRDYEDGFHTGCRNVSHKQQSFLGLQSRR